MAVHLTCFLATKPIRAPGQKMGSAPMAQAGVIMTAVPLEFNIAAAAVALPAGTQLVQIDETAGTSFRYAFGASDVTVPAAGSAHRFLGDPIIVGVHPIGGALSDPVAATSVYIRTAAA